jgi:hypothetical protein
VYTSFDTRVTTWWSSWVWFKYLQLKVLQVDKLTYKEQEVSLLVKLDRHEEGAELYKALLSINPDNYRWFNLLNISEKKENVHLTEMTGLLVNVAVCVFVIPTMNLATSVFCLSFFFLSKTNVVIWNWYLHCRCLPHIFGYYNFWWVILFGVTRFVLKFTMNQNILFSEKLLKYVSASGQWG